MEKTNFCPGYCHFCGWYSEELKKCDNDDLCVSGCHFEKKEGLYTPEEFAKKMRELKKEYSDDLEERHILMDELMLDLLITLGYIEGCQVFADTKMWYS